MFPTNQQRQSVRMRRAWMVGIAFAIIVTMALTGRIGAHAQPESATLNRWVSNGPDGASVLALAIDPSNPATIYAGTTTGVFKSTNGGESWNSSLSNASIQIVAIAPTTPTTIYAAGDGIYKTIDGGASWNSASQGLQDQFGHFFATALAIDPANANIVYTAGPDIDEGGTFKAIYRTTDGAESWSIIKHSIRSFAVHHALEVDPTNSNTIYAAGEVGWGSVWKSSDNGHFWDIFYLGYDISYTVYALRIDPTNTNTIYAGTASRGIFRSTDGGATWSEFNDGLPAYSSDKNRKYYFSVSSIVIDPNDPRVIYAGTSGVFKSANGGSWSTLTGDLPNLYVNALAINSSDPNIVYAGTYNGIIKTINRGATWNSYNRGLRGANVDFVVVNPGNANVYAVTSAGKFKSINNGESWSATNFYPRAFDPHDPNTIYGHLDGSDGLFETTNGGATWSSVTVGPPNLYTSLVAIDPNNSNVRYIETDVLYKSTNGGVSWGAIGNLPYFYAYLLAIDPSNSQILYASASTDGDSFHVFQSVDGGATWNPSGSKDGPTFYWVSVLAIDPKNSSTLYTVACAVDPCGIYKSTDSGGNWTLAPAQVPNDDISSLVVDPVQPNVIYVGTYGHGVFKSSDGGASLNPFNDGLTDLHINALAMDAEGNVLHAATSSGEFDVQLASVKPNLIDNTQFFVRQHYRDFLNREADPDGLNFWTGEIFLCGSDPQCIEVRRINDSASFFLSIEFQESGYLAYRFHKAAFGNLPGAPVPIRFADFVADDEQLGQGVIVNQAGWEQVLENNKQLFANQFVQRARFSSAYPTSLRPAQFVDALFANAVVVPSTTDRDAAINEFGLANTTDDMAARARTLRRVAENPLLTQQEFNRAFVLMQYFGYLRRNPDDAPDGNFDGYNFWLNKLNQFNGNFIDAEMVKAFLSSIEYRRRFGP